MAYLKKKAKQIKLEHEQMYIKVDKFTRHHKLCTFHVNVQCIYTLIHTVYMYTYMLIHITNQCHVQHTNKISFEFSVIHHHYHWMRLSYETNDRPDEEQDWIVCRYKQIINTAANMQKLCASTCMLTVQVTVYMYINMMQVVCLVSSLNLTHIHVYIYDVIVLLYFMSSIMLVHMLVHDRYKV